MTRTKQAFNVLVAATAVVVFSITPAQAKKPDNPGGGGGGSPLEPRFSVIDIPIEAGLNTRLSDANSNGVITVALTAPSSGYGSGAFAKVASSSGSVLRYGFLPEPELVDTDGTVYANGWSGAYDVNASGVIAGYSATFHPDLGPGPFHPTIWRDDGAGYAMLPLPLPEGASEATAYGINNRGDVVGNTHTPGDPGDGMAVLWDAESHQPVQLNTDATAALGWQLKFAIDINDDGWIVGSGQLNGVDRGFVLDHKTQQIWAVPLLAPATANHAERINAQGRVVGNMSDGDGDAYGLNPDFFSAYSWDGPGSDPEFLPSATDNTSFALGLNDSGGAVGYSIIPTDYAVEGPFADDTVATLWEPDDAGIMQAINLRDVIPSKPEYRLDYAFDINNDGWISAYGKKFYKGQYSWPTILLMPNASSSGALTTTQVPEPITAAYSIAAAVIAFALRRKCDSRREDIDGRTITRPVSQ